MKMNHWQQLSIFAIIGLITLLFSNVLTVQCYPDITIDEFDCSPQLYQDGSPYASEIDLSLDEMAYMTVDHTHRQMYIMGRYASGFAYCQGPGQVSYDDCIICLEEASKFLREDCPNAIWAYVVMIDCGMRYCYLGGGNNNNNNK